jgi:Prokaryotic membrane lipoprotein lipid attachment site
MKKSIIIFLSILVLSGCSSLGGLLGDMAISGSDPGKGQPQEQEKAVAEGKGQETQPESDAGKGSGMDISAFLSPDLQFSLYYASYFFLGGYGFGDDNFRDGEGIKWSISTNTETDEIIVTRARLKTLGNGSAWWFFSTEVNGEEIFYEMLIKNDYDLVKVRYLNSNTGAFDEFIPEGADSDDSDTVETLDTDVYNRFKVGSESIRTKAGSFKADHIVLEEKGAEFKYEYWIADRAPGHIVKYRYENTAENQVMTGEIIDIRGGYRTRLDSY